jgi:hypothetical protein
MRTNIPTLEISNLNSEGIAYCEAKGLSLVFAAYAEYASHSPISGIGFNEYSGYIYIVLENNIQICSELGKPVEYIIWDHIKETESFFDSFYEAIGHINNNR